MLKKISLFVILSSISLPVWAEQVEMIVFLNKQTNWEKEERWPPYPGDLMLKSSKPLDKSNSAINIVEHNNLQLNNTYAKLKTAKQFKPIYHIAWQQTITSSKKMPLHFKFSDINNLSSGEGVIDVQRMGNVFRAKLDLILNDKDLKTSAGVRLNHVAKIKNKELYYFDHPVFGVLLYITNEI